MDYTSQLRSMLLRYPTPGSKVYIDPTVCNCEQGILCDFKTDLVEVDTPEEADFIPIWLDYTHRLSDELLNKYVIPYPNKCMHTVNFIQHVNAFMDEISEQTVKDIKEMLSSPDWETIYLGLNLIRTYQLTPETENLAKIVIDTFQPDCSNNSGTLIPYPKDITALQDPEKNRITIQDLGIIKFFYAWLHNEFLTI